MRIPDLSVQSGKISPALLLVAIALIVVIALLYRSFPGLFSKAAATRAAYAAPPPDHIRTEYPLHVTFTDGSNDCVLSEGTRLPYRYFFGYDQNVMSGFIEVSEGFCPHLKVRHLMIATGRQVRAATAAKKEEAGQIRIGSFQTETTLYRGRPEQCVIPAGSQARLVGRDPSGPPPSPQPVSRMVVLEDDLCPALHGLDRQVAVPSANIK